MQRILFAIIMVLLLSGISISQTLEFHAYKVAMIDSVEESTESLQYHAYGVIMIDNKTKRSTSYTADFTIIFTDDYMIFKNNNIDSITRWEFIGNVFKITKTAFYTYAFDENGVRCRIWFKAQKDGYALLGIEYKNHNFLYRIKKINIRRT